MQPKPLSVDDLLGVQRPTGGVPLHLSPDGRWLTLSVRPACQGLSLQGQWFNEEVAGSQVLVLDTGTGELLRDRGVSWLEMHLS